MWAPTIVTVGVVAIVDLFGSSILAITVSRNDGAGWALWFHPLIAFAPVLVSMCTGVGVNSVINVIARRWEANWLSDALWLLVRVLVVMFVVWIFASVQVFTAIVSMTPVTNEDAEHLFFLGWYELANQDLVSSSLFMLAIFSLRLRSGNKYWLAAAIIMGIYGVWGLVGSLSTLVTSLT